MAGMMAMMRMMHAQGMGPGMASGMMASGMMAPGMMAPGGPAHIEGQIAFFKAELAITEAETPQWNAFADVLREQAKKMRQTQPQQAAAATAPELIERRIAMLTTRTEAMQAVLGGLKPLYAVLTDEQKKTADTLMAEHLISMRGARQ